MDAQPTGPGSALDLELTFDDDRYVIGVDGGESTGISVLRDVKLFAVYQGDWCDALEWLDDVVNKLTEPDFGAFDVALAAERFTHGAGAVRGSSQPRAGRVYAAVEDLARRHRIEFSGQGPAEAKRIAPNALLRTTGLYVTGRRLGTPDANDANDATRHAVLFLARRRASVFARLLASQP